LIASGGNFNNKKARAKEKSGAGLDGCLDDVCDIKNYFLKFKCTVADMIIKYERNEATLSKNEILKCLYNFNKTL
jgi:hypothetical protein